MEITGKVFSNKEAMRAALGVGKDRFKQLLEDGLPHRDGIFHGDNVDAWLKDYTKGQTPSN